MKIALKAANGRFVCAEQGGGIDSRVGGAVAVRADRGAIGAWETWDVETLADGLVALKTCDGFYLTAELGGGGAVRTNETAIGPWEQFALEHGTFRTWDGAHFLCAEVGAADPIVNATRTAARSWETFEIVVLEAPAPAPGPRPPIGPLPDRHVWRGAFVIPQALPGIPYGDGQRIWTPAYGCYDDVWRTAIRVSYVGRGYTHFVYNCAGLPYGRDYPELADDPARVARDLLELLSAGLVPVVCATDDRYPDTVLYSFAENADLVPVCFPCWEMNGPLGDPDKDKEEARQQRLIEAVRAAAPTADCYLHFTPGHGSISYRSESDGWRWCQDHGTTGLLAQGSNDFPPEDPVTGGEGLDSTAIRLAGRTDLGAPGAWAGLRQRTVKFEYGVWRVYQGGVSEQQQREYTQAFLAHAPHVVGYCDGGPA